MTVCPYVMGRSGGGVILQGITCGKAWRQTSGGLVRRSAYSSKRPNRVFP